MKRGHLEPHVEAGLTPASTASARIRALNAGLLQFLIAEFSTVVATVAVFFVGPTREQQQMDGLVLTALLALAVGSMACGVMLMIARRNGVRGFRGTA